MHGTWNELIFSIIISATLVYLPGFAIARALNIRGFLSIGLAPVFSISLVACTGVIFSYVGIPWSIIGLFLVAIITTVFAAIIRVLLKNENEIEIITWRKMLLPTIFALIAGSILMLRTYRALQVPYAASHLYDANYHYNNVANMLETGDVSSLNMLQLPPNTTFYPAAWHDFVTSIIHITGTTIPVAANAFTYFMLCVVWPLSMLTFALIVNRNTTFLCTVGLLSTVVSFFPGMYLWFGMLYANVVASSFLPAVLMVVIAFLMCKNFLHWWQTIIFGIASFLALVFSQPNAVFTVYYVFLIVLPFAAYKLGKELDEKEKDTTYKNRTIFLTIAILVDILLEICVTYISWKSKTLHGLRFDFDVAVLAPHGYKSGILTFLSATTEGWHGSILPFLMNLPIAIGMFIGAAVVLYRRQNSWLVIAWLWFSFINFVASSLPNSYFRAFISGAYYGERIRLISVQTIFMIIFIAIAVLFVFEKIKFVTRNRNGQYAFNKLTIIGLVVVFAGAQFVPEYSAQFKNVNLFYGQFETNDELTVSFSKQELRFMQRNMRKLEPGYTVVGNPWKGATASWFLFGQKNVLYHTAYPSDENQLLIARELNKAKENPKVCEAVKHFNLRYVYSFPGRCIWDHPCEEQYKGLNNLVENGVAKVIDQDEHGNQLLELNVCP